MPDRPVNTLNDLLDAIDDSREMPCNAKKDLRTSFSKIRSGRSIRSVAEEDNVPFETLRNAYKKNEPWVFRSGPESDLGPALEKALVDDLLRDHARGYAWPVPVLLRRAADLGIRKGIWKKGHELSYTWLKGLYTRFPNLVDLCPSSADARRCDAETIDGCNSLYDILEPLFEKHKYTAVNS